MGQTRIWNSYVEDQASTAWIQEVADAGEIVWLTCEANCRDTFFETFWWSTVFISLSSIYLRCDANKDYNPHMCQESELRWMKFFFFYSIYFGKCLLCDAADLCFMGKDQFHYFFVEEFKWSDLNVCTSFSLNWWRKVSVEYVKLSAGFGGSTCVSALHFPRGDIRRIGRIHSAMHFI